MCGIAGILGVDRDNAAPAADRMLRALKHRGPDADGLQAVADPTGTAPAVHLIHTRLAILDLSAAGRQPMCDPGLPEGRRPWIVFNGEIYNYHEVQADLRPLGLVRAAAPIRRSFCSLTELGEPSPSTDYAACSLSPSSIRNVDRSGLPVIASASSRFISISPRPAGSCSLPKFGRFWRPVPNSCRRVFRAQLSNRFWRGAVFGLEAHVEGVRLLPPGETLTTDWFGKQIDSKRYWNIPFIRDTRPHSSRSEAVEQLGRVARKAVRQHLIADVPVGVFLSSGIDSTAIATLATEVAAGQVRTISIGFDRPEFDETEIAGQFARELGTDHRTIRLTAADIRTNFDRVLASMDQPTVDGFNTYYVSRAAREAGVTVALSGLGGDEVFGGYASFRDVPRALRLLRLARPRSAARAGFSLLSKGLRSRGLLKLAEACARPVDAVHLYLLRRELFLATERRSLFPLPQGSDAYTGLTAESLNALSSVSQGLDPENGVSALELCGYMRHMLLRDSDVFSMAHGLELRVPLLDHELVSAAAGLPGVWKQPGKTSKKLLIDAVGKKLPPRVGTLPKRGFTFPWPDWFRGDLASVASERLHDRNVWASLGFDPAAPAKLWQRFQRRDPAVGGLHVLALVVLADLAARQGLHVN